jgi:hypothetical protein
MVGQYEGKFLVNMDLTFANNYIKDSRTKNNITGSAASATGYRTLVGKLVPHGFDLAHLRLY